MADCVYIYKGNTYSPARFASLTRQGLIDSIDYVNLGKKISVADAEAYLKSVFGDLPQGTYQFLSMHAMHKLSHPGETLIGLMDEGIMSFLKRTDGTTTEQIVRHETFHRVFNYYLNEAQRADLVQAVEDSNPELKGKDIVTIEEHLADQFQDYVQEKPVTLADKVKEFFKNLLSFFNIYTNSKDKINGMFKAIDSGFFKNQSVETGSFNNIRRNLSVNVREFGVNDYTEAVRLMESIYEFHMFEGNRPMTTGEAMDKVRESLQREADNGHVLAKKILQRNPDQEYTYLAQFFDDAFNKEIIEDKIEEIDESTGESFFRDHIMLNDQKNREERTSLAVKSFLNYIVPANLLTAAQMQKAKHKRVPPRFAFISAAQIMDGVDMTQEPGKILEDIKKNTIEIADGNKVDFIYDLATPEEVSNLREMGHIPFKEWGSRPGDGNVYTIAVGKKLMKLVEAAFDDNISKQGKFTDENTFYYSTDPNINVLKLRPTQLEAMFKKEEIGKITRTKNHQDSLAFVQDVGRAFEIDTVKAARMFKQRQAHNRLADMTALFGSMYKKNLYVAERKNNYGNFSYKYFAAATDGVRLGVKSMLRESFVNKYIVDGKVNPKFRIGKTKNKDVALERVKEYLGNLGLPADLYQDITSKRAVTILDKLARLSERTTEALKTKEKVKSDDTVAAEISEDSMSIEKAEGMTEDQLNQIAETDTQADPDAVLESDITIQDIIDKSFTSVIQLLSESIQDSKPLKTSESVKAADGKKMYLLANSSNAHDVLTALRDRMSNKTSRNRSIPPHLKNNFYGHFNRFVRSGDPLVLDIIDHDGTKLFGDYAKDFTSETGADWLARNLNIALVDWIADRTLNYDDKKNYVQYLPTMDRGRVMGVETPFMTPDQVSFEVKNVLLQMAERPNIQGLKGYKRNSTINFEILQQLADQGNKEAIKFLSDPKAESVTDSLVDNLMEVMDQNAEQWVAEMLNQQFLFSSNLNKVKKALYQNGFITNKDFKSAEESKFYDSGEAFYAKQTGRDGQYITQAEHIRGIAKAFYRNHYVNSYMLAQTVVGDAAFFPNGAAYLKRLDKVFGPGERGLVNIELGVPKRSRIMIVDSVKQEVLDSFFTDRDGNPLPIHGMEFDPNDGQGFMLVERMEEIAEMHGPGAKVGNILKPLHYELVPKKLPTGETDANGKPIYQEVMVPVMLKYSSVVLTEDVVKAFPMLKQVRDNMRNNGVMEMVFDTVVKVGTPDSNSLISSQDMMYENLTFTEDQLNSSAFYDISNQNYRLQLNPVHKVDSQTAIPSQLIYFLNALTDSVNFQKASEIYNNVAKLIKRGGANFMNNTSTAAELRKMLVDKGFSKNDQRSAELLQSGLSLNFPVLNNPVIMAYVSALNKSSTKIKFPGSKLVLQADYGTDNILDKDGKTLRNRRLKYVTEKTKDGEYSYAEVILPREFEHLVSRGEYLSADAFGFRIPSSELHSAVPMKVVAFYDAKDANTVIAPSELVALHGSDFDVDSLFVIRRNNYQGARELGIALEILGKDYTETMKRNFPIGYTNINGKYVIDPKFEKKLDDYRKSLYDVKNKNYIENNDYRNQVLEAVESIREKYWMNSITEGLIEFTSSRRNASRMYSTIDMGLYNAKSDRIGESKNIAIAEDVQTKFDAKSDDFKPVFEALGKSLKTISPEAIPGVLKAYTNFRQNAEHTMLSKQDLEGFTQWASRKYNENSVFGMLEDLGVPLDINYDLSDVRGNKDAHHAIFQGNSLVGKFANGMKAVAYLLRSSAPVAFNEVMKETQTERKRVLKNLQKLHKNLEAAEQIKDTSLIDKYKAEIKIENDINQKLISELVTELRKHNTPEYIIKQLESGEDAISQVPTNFSLGFGDRVFDQIHEQEIGKDGKPTGRSVWAYFDALLNSAIDNLKEQILTAINASSNTITGWVAMTSMGVDANTITQFMRQPAIMALNNFDNTAKAIGNLRIEFENTLFSKGYDVESIQALSKDINITDSELLRGIELWKENPILQIDKLSDADLKSQYQMLMQFVTAHKIGSGISTLSRAISNTLVLPTKGDDFAKMQEDWAEIGEVITDNGFSIVQTKPSFPFDVTYLLENVPHLKEAYALKEDLIQKKSELFFKYNKRVDQFLKELNVSVKLDYNNVKSQEKLRDEVLKFIASAAVQMDANVMPYHVKINGKNTGEVLHGSAAFTQHFAEKIIALKNTPGVSDNKFLAALSVSTTRFGKKHVKLNGVPNMEYTDILDMENSFRELNTLEITNDNGWKVSRNEFAKDIFTDFQREFITYSLLTNGLGFAKSNYNTVLPMELLKEASNRMEKHFKHYETGDNLSKIQDLFEVSLASNYHESLPKMRSLRKMKLKEGVDKESKTLTDEDFEVTEGSEHLLSPVRINDKMSGVFKEMFYDLRFNASLHKDKMGSIRPPHKYIRHFKGDMPFVLVGQDISTNGDNVQVNYLYKRLNKNRGFESHYEIPPNIVKNGYFVHHALPADIPTINVLDISKNAHTLNEVGYPYTVGLRMKLYSKGDMLKLHPREVRITEVKENKLQLTKEDGTKIDAGTEYLVTVEDLISDRISKDDLNRLQPVTEQQKLDVQGVQRLNDQPLPSGEMSLPQAISKMADRLSQTEFDMLNVLSIHIGPDVKVIFGETEPGIGGYYGWENNNLTIKIGNNKGPENVGRTMVHEAAHAATAHIITMFNFDSNALTAKQREAVADLLDIYSLVNSELSLQQEYGLTNIHEFIAEAFANEKFQRALDTIELGKKTVWDRVLDALSEMLLVGVVLKALGVDSSRKTALSYTLTNAISLMQQEKSPTSEIRSLSYAAYVGNRSLNSSTLAMNAKKLSDSEVLERIKNCI